MTSSLGLRTALTIEFTDLRKEDRSNLLEYENRESNTGEEALWRKARRAVYEAHPRLEEYTSLENAGRASGCLANWPKSVQFF